MTTHEHEWILSDSHEDDYRTRTRDTCNACGATRYGCFAKRLDDAGRAVWGQPGEQWYKIVERPA